MKYYESHYEEYISSVEKFNLHPELTYTYNNFPKKIQDLENLIIYGPTGIGKYSQVLYLLKRYSPSELKYDKKIMVQTEKQQYVYRISDIHYEVDMSLLGCNSKLLWHELFFQIVDVISVKQEKIGVIVCKNFHLIHTELLEIFYSYMQQYNHSQSNIKIKFFILTEHLSFLPTPVINACHVLKMGRPAKDDYIKLTALNTSKLDTGDDKRAFLQRISNYKNNLVTKDSTNKSAKEIINSIESNGITNMKEFRYFPLLETCEDIPKDVFNIICDNVIQEIIKPKDIKFPTFRDTLYDILTYNLDMTECLWYILAYFIDNNFLHPNDISDILTKSFTFLKHYNNNYRPIYHLESIIFYIINKIHNYK